MSNPQQQPSILEGWQHHVLTCNQCGTAIKPDDLCQIGKNFWRLPGSATFPIQQPQHPLPIQQPQHPLPIQQPHQQPFYDPYQGAPPFQAPYQVVPPFHEASHHLSVNVNVGGGGADLNSLANRIVERVIARSSSGHEVAIPMEKTSKGITFSTAPGVVMQMPERDIEVYGSMSGMIQKYLRFANRLGTYMTTMQESRRMGREAGITIGERETSAIVMRVSQQQNMPNLDLSSLYDEFAEVASMTIRLGDVLGRFMAVDTDTRAIMREARALGVNMQGELERSLDGRLVVDEQTPRILRDMRMLAVSLKGEMERRLGTA